MIVTTTDTIQNQVISDYLGVVTAEVVYGTNVLRDFFAGIRDTIGGRTGSYERVFEKGQLKAIEEVQPGKPYNEFHDMAVCVLVQGLIDLGLLKGDLEEIIKEEKYKPFYMHRTGHWLGLDVHDVGVYKHNQESWQILQPGHILTVEPGIYISPHIQPAEGQPEIPDNWKGIGIRIEDDLLVTETGHDILTAAVPKSLSDMEK